LLVVVVVLVVRVVVVVQEGILILRSPFPQALRTQLLLVLVVLEQILQVLEITAPTPLLSN